MENSIAIEASAAPDTNIVDVVHGIERANDFLGEALQVCCCLVVVEKHDRDMLDGCVLRAGPAVDEGQR
jgi:hypothetical protein